MTTSALRPELDDLRTRVTGTVTGDAAGGCTVRLAVDVDTGTTPTGGGLGGDGAPPGVPGGAPPRGGPGGTTSTGAPPAPPSG